MSGPPVNSRLQFKQIYFYKGRYFDPLIVLGLVLRRE